MQRRTRLERCQVLVSRGLVGGLLLCAGLAHAQSLVQLNPVAPDTTVSISSVSGDGSTVVGSVGSNNTLNAAVWSSSTGVGTRLPAAFSPTSGFVFYVGVDANIDGSVLLLRGSDASFQIVRPIRLVRPSSATNLGAFPTASFAYGTSISDNGLSISGWGGLNSTGTLQTVWRWSTANPVLTAITSSSGGNSGNNGLQGSRYMSRNGRYIIVAKSLFDTVTSTYTVLPGFPNPGGPAYAYEAALSVSDDGIAVGSAELDLAGYNDYPVRWVNGVIETIAPLGQLPGYRARAISADGRTILITPINGGQPKIWRQGEGVRDLVPYMQSLGINTANISDVDPWAVSNNGRVVVGRMFVTSVGGRGFALNLPAILVCDSVDFNRDGFFPDSLDLDDFVAVLSGGPGACSNAPNCGDIDFNNDGLFPDSADLDAFLSRLSGGPCI
jgi:hypothetical protein